MKKIPVVAVVGPTASGKSDLAVEICLALDGEVVSADSMQIYKGIDISTAKPDDEEKKGIPHHMMDFLDNTESFSVADYQKLAGGCIRDIHLRGKLPVVVGGTGLYINSLVDNITFSEDPVSDTLRAELTEKFDKIGGQAMLEELRAFDPDSVDRLHPNNKKRIIRAFEIYLSTGITMTRQLEASRLIASPSEPFMIGIGFSNRELLYERINLRVDKMLEKGLLSEAEAAYKNQNAATASQAIGHKELFPYFSGDLALEAAAEALKASTRRYAKRQLTWFRRDERINWIYRDECDDITLAALEILERNGYFE